MTAEDGLDEITESRQILAHIDGFQASGLGELHNHVSAATDIGNRETGNGSGAHVDDLMVPSLSHIEAGWNNQKGIYTGRCYVFHAGRIAQIWTNVKLNNVSFVKLYLLRDHAIAGRLFLLTEF